jgi:hypothetical protein
MKNFLIDACLVGLFVFLINGLFNDYNIQNVMFEREINQFEEDVQNDEVINYNYAVVSDDSENLLSLTIKGISDFCISIIETIILLISNFISMLV